jgi:hypothetical protein
MIARDEAVQCPFAGPGFGVVESTQARETAGQRLLVEASFLEALHDQLRDALSVVHRRTARRQFWTTTQTRPEAY